MTGLVDAASYLKLGHVFVANMTGNVVFLGFAIAGAGGLSIGASLFAIAAFLAGSVAGGRLGARMGGDRGALLAAATSMQAVAVAVAAALAAAVGDHPGRPARDGLIVLLAVAMGLQNAVARRLAVPDLTTTVLTLTLTGIGADSSLGGGPGSKSGRRLAGRGRDARRRAGRRPARTARLDRRPAGRGRAWCWRSSPSSLARPRRALGEVTRGAG